MTRTSRYTFKFLTTELRRHDKICGYVYTELTDIEWEHNGFLNYDRTPKEFGYDHFVPGMTVADLNGADFVGLDAPPCRTVLPRVPRFSVRRSSSPTGTAVPLKKPVLRWRVTAIDRFRRDAVKSKTANAVTPEAVRRHRCRCLSKSQLPNETCLVTVALSSKTAPTNTSCPRAELRERGAA